MLTFNSMKESLHSSNNHENSKLEIMNNENMLHLNKSRRLFSKDMQQDKVIPPPVQTTLKDFERKKIEKFSFIENQQILLDIIQSILKKQPKIYHKFTDILLTRITSSYPVPSDEQYLEILPRRSNYDFDVFIRKIFIQNPIFIGFLSILADDPVEFIKSYIIIKSLLANMIGDWNIITHLGNEPDHIFITIELLKVLKKVSFIFLDLIFIFSNIILFLKKGKMVSC